MGNNGWPDTIDQYIKSVRRATQKYLAKTHKATCDAAVASKFIEQLADFAADEAFLRGVITDLPAIFIEYFDLGHAHEFDIHIDGLKWSSLLQDTTDIVLSIVWRSDDCGPIPPEEDVH